MKITIEFKNVNERQEIKICEWLGKVCERHSIPATCKTEREEK